MGYKVNIPGFEGQDIEVRVSFWSGPTLLVNGQPAPKGSRRGEMLLRSNDGRSVVAKWKPRFLGLDVPQLVVDGKVIDVVEPLKWYQWLWGGLPIALVFVGGLLGGIIGVIGFTINAKVFRTEIGDALKYLVSGIVTLLAFIAYFIVALIITLLIYGA